MLGLASGTGCARMTDRQAGKQQLGASKGTIWVVIKMYDSLHLFATVGGLKTPSQCLAVAVSHRMLDDGRRGRRGQ